MWFSALSHEIEAEAVKIEGEVEALSGHDDLSTSEDERWKRLK